MDGRIARVEDHRSGGVLGDRLRFMGRIEHGPLGAHGALPFEELPCQFHDLPGHGAGQVRGLAGILPQVEQFVPPVFIVLDELPVAGPDGGVGRGAARVIVRVMPAEMGPAQRCRALVSRDQVLVWLDLKVPKLASNWTLMPDPEAQQALKRWL